MYEKILVPTDGSSGSEVALEHAAAIASQFGATVHLLNVIDRRRVGIGARSGDREGGSPGLGSKQKKGDDPGLGGEPAFSKEAQDKLRDRGEKLLKETKEGLEGITTETAVRSGNPHQAILAYAEENDIDLIVMGTQGKTGVKRHLLGSVTEKVVRISETPVVTVRKGKQDD